MRQLSQPEDNRKTGACDRCLRKGAQCTYSSCLPKGRPALYRLNDASKGSRGAPKSLSTSSTSPGSRSTAPLTPVLPDQQQLGDMAPGSPAEVDADQHNSVDDMDMNDDAFALPASLDSLPNFCASWWPAEHMEHGNSMPSTIPWSTFDLDPALEAHSLSRLEFSGHFANSCEGFSKMNRNGARHGQVHTRHSSLGLDTDLDESGSMNSSGRGARDSCDSRGAFGALSTSKDGFEPSIAHLSQLSTHLSQLLGSSRGFLAEITSPSGPSKNHDPELRVQIGIRAAFKSLNAWLVHEPADASTTSSLNLGSANSFDLLHYVFSASNHLLEMLHHPYGNTGARTRTSSTSNSTCPSLTASSLSSGSHLERTPPRPGSDGAYQPNSVTHHLVLVCMTLLLNMYITILIALQRSADVLNSSARRRRGNSLEPYDDMEAASRVHLQLVSLVQLCSCFIKRLNQAWDATMSGGQGILHPNLPRGHDHRQSSSSDCLVELGAEVEQRLRRLQESLCIIP
ncbi:hypothetical protein ACO1O0_006070 [Amphichorda felina]